MRGQGGVAAEDVCQGFAINDEDESAAVLFPRRCWATLAVLGWSFLDRVHEGEASLRLTYLQREVLDDGRRGGWQTPLQADGVGELRENFIQSLLLTQFARIIRPEGSRAAQKTSSHSQRGPIPARTWPSLLRW